MADRQVRPIDELISLLDCDEIDWKLNAELVHHGKVGFHHMRRQMANAALSEKQRRHLIRMMVRNSTYLTWEDYKTAIPALLDLLKDASFIIRSAALQALANVVLLGFTKWDHDLDIERHQSIVRKEISIDSYQSYLDLQSLYFIHTFLRIDPDRYKWIEKSLTRSERIWLAPFAMRFLGGIPSFTCIEMKQAKRFCLTRWDERSVISDPPSPVYMLESRNRILPICINRSWRAFELFVNTIGFDQIDVHTLRRILGYAPIRSILMEFGTELFPVTPGEIEEAGWFAPHFDNSKIECCTYSVFSNEMLHLTIETNGNVSTRVIGKKPTSSYK